MVVATKSGLILGECRLVVVGQRGAYAQIEKDGINQYTIYVPPHAKWRMSPGYRNRVSYFEFRTKRDNVMVYFQRKRVPFADYLPGYLYIAVGDLFVTGIPLAQTDIPEHNPENLRWRKAPVLPGLEDPIPVPLPRTCEQRLADMLGVDYPDGVPEYAGRLLRAAESVVNRMECGGRNFLVEVRDVLRCSDISMTEFKQVCSMASRLMQTIREDTR